MAFAVVIGGQLGGLVGMQAAPTPAIEADRFVASTAVATHWRFNNVYMTNYVELADKLIDSGIRHSRDTGTDRAYVAKIQKLADAGVKNIAMVHPGSGTRPNTNYWANSPAYTIDQYVHVAGRDVVAFVEMNNELDMVSQQSGTYWYTAVPPATPEPVSNDPGSSFYYADYLQAATAHTWTQLSSHADPSIANLPLIGPSLVTDAAYVTVGDLGDDVDYSNVHHYQYGWNPETTTIRGIDHAITYQSQVQAPGGGMIATEGGWASATSLMGSLSYLTHGRYLPRYFLAHFMKGFAVTTSYEFVDEGTNPANQEDNFGLLKNDLSEKPAYAAVKNLLSLLSDPGPAFAPGSLDYTLSGNTANVSSALFRKRNGDYYLCLWLALPCYDPTNGATINVPAQSVSLNLPASIVSGRIFTLNDAGAMSASVATISNKKITLSVTDRVSVVRLSTAASGGAASTPHGLRAVPASGAVALKWAPVVEATGYSVKRAASSDGTYATIASGLSSPAFTDTGRTNGTRYYYVVSATHAGGQSADSRPICAVPAVPITLDNADGAGITLTGGWTPSTSVAGYYGTNFLHDGNTGSAGGGRSVRFTPTVPVAGCYDVYVRWPASANRATNTPIDIVHAQGTETVRLNQQQNSNVWMLLGSFNLNAGTSGGVVIRNDGANGYVAADAVRFELTVPRPPRGLTASTSGSPVNLTWIAMPGAASYSIKRATSPDGPFTTLAAGLANNAYSDSTAVGLVQYYYVVTATNAGGESRDSFPVKGAVSVEVIMDNADATGVTQTGAWTLSASVAGYHGTNFLHDGNTGSTGGKKVTFAPTLPGTANYHVYLRWTTSLNRADNTPVDIVHAGGVQTISVNQKNNNGTWMLIGTYTLAPGAASVSVRNDGANGYVIADAVKFALE